MAGSVARHGESWVQESKARFRFKQTGTRFNGWPGACMGQGESHARAVMKYLVLSVAVLISTATAVDAAELTGDDVVVIAVAPRSPDVQPFFLPVPQFGHRKALESAHATGSAQDGRGAPVPYRRDRQDQISAATLRVTHSDGNDSAR